MRYIDPTSQVSGESCGNKSDNGELEDCINQYGKRFDSKTTCNPILIDTDDTCKK